jgi:hypothetical protein
VLSFIRDLVTLAVCGKRDVIFELFKKVGILGPNFDPVPRQHPDTPFCCVAYFGDSDYVHKVFIQKNADQLSHMCHSGENLLATALCCENEIAFEVPLKSHTTRVGSGAPMKIPIWEAVQKENLEALSTLVFSGRTRVGCREVRELRQLALELQHHKLATWLVAAGISGEHRPSEESQESCFK